MDRDSGSFVRKTKAAHASKVKEEFIHYSPSAGRCLAASCKAGPQHL